MKYGLGVVIGKFYPPHRGHSFLIEQALAQSEKVIVIVCERPTDTIPGSLREKWLKELHPHAHIMLIDDRYDEQDSAIWAENTRRWLGRFPDAVFTSEDYGDRYAELMNARHVLVDKARLKVPSYGRAIRKDPYANWEFISAPLRAYFAKRICVLGAESTGTTTLAEALAKYFHTEWVAEYGREYSEAKVRTLDQVWHSQEFENIAREQARREDVAASTCNRLLVCDTNAFATILWHRRYMNFHSTAVEAIASEGRCDLYLLTGDEIPFVQDGLRDGEHVRHEMHCWFVESLSKQSVPWHQLSGSHESRMNEAIKLIRALFEGSAWRP